MQLCSGVPSPERLHRHINAFDIETVRNAHWQVGENLSLRLIVCPDKVIIKRIQKADLNEDGIIRLFDFARRRVQH